MKSSLRAGWFGLLGVFLPAPVPAAGPPVTRPIQIANSLEAQVPSPLRTLLLENPRARFMITVNEEGRLVDFLATEATHYELLPRAEEILQQAGYSPALDRGRPVQSSAEVTVTFYDPDQVAYRRGLVRMPFGSTTTESSARRLYAGARDRFIYRRAGIAELDRPVEMLATKVRVLVDADGRPPVGECVIEFFVDARGDVRQPRVVSADNDPVARSALLTLQETRFAPVTRAGGVPAYVKVRQPMSYAAPAGTAPAAK